MVRRFFAPTVLAEGRTVELPDDEAEHLVRVLRLRAGDTIGVFDGRGNEFSARVDTAERKRVRVTPLARVPAAREPAVRVVLAQAVLKADKMDRVVRDATMVGVSAVQPLVSARTDPSLGPAGGSARIGRWRRIAVASAKQCGRAVVPDIFPPLSLADALATSREGVRLMFVEPTGNSPHSSPEIPTRPDSSTAMLVIGPEGGWSPEEIARALECGFELMTFGTRIFRADVAVVAILAVLQYAWGDL